MTSMKAFRPAKIKKSSRKHQLYESVSPAELSGDGQVMNIETLSGQINDFGMTIMTPLSVNNEPSSTKANQAVTQS